MRPHALILSAVVLAAVSSVAGAQQATIIRCGTGTTSTSGVEINAAGELVFEEDSIVCGSAGTTLPPPLGLTITSPAPNSDINVAPGPQSVQFSATLSNFTTPYDACPNLTLTQPGGAATTVPLQIQGTSTITGNAVLNFDAQSVMGSYRAQLNCARTVEQQQILLNLPFVNFTVSGGGDPDNCPAAPSFMSVTERNWGDSTTQGGFGVAFGGIFNRVFSAGNASAAPATLNVRAWKFRTPATPMTGTLALPPGNSGVLAFGDCPGTFDVPAACRSHGGNAQIVWTTAGTSGQCQLEPDTVYYLSGAHFSLSQFVSSGAYNSTCGCQNPPCSACNLSLQHNQAN